MGGIVGHLLPGGPAAWALLGMAGALAGVTRSPLTSVVFTFELTHAVNTLLPLLVTCAVAHLISTLVLKRSILTEKVARKGFHVVREYAVDPLEALFVREVMQTDIVSVNPDETIDVAARRVSATPGAQRQRILPVLGDDQSLVGIVTLGDLHRARHDDRRNRTIRDIAEPLNGAVHPDEALRAVAERMAADQLSALLVLSDEDSIELLGIVTVEDLLTARQRQLGEERHRERPAPTVRNERITQNRPTDALRESKLQRTLLHAWAELTADFVSDWWAARVSIPAPWGLKVPCSSG